MAQTCRTHSTEHKCVHDISIGRTVLGYFMGIITDFRERNLSQVVCECYKVEREMRDITARQTIKFRDRYILYKKVVLFSLEAHGC